VIGGVEFSREDDIENMEKLSNLFGQIFYTYQVSPGDPAAADAWTALSTDIWALVQHARQVPALALSVAMCLYNYFWWEGPQSSEPNAMSGIQASELMYLAVLHARCNDPSMPAFDFYVQHCHLRWSFLWMLAGETGRHLTMHRRDLPLSGEVALR